MDHYQEVMVALTEFVMKNRVKPGGGLMMTDDEISDWQYNFVISETMVAKKLLWIYHQEVMWSLFQNPS